MAKKKKDDKKDVKFEKFMPGESGWQGRKNKTRQDRTEMGNRDRVIDAERIRSFSQEHKPRKSSDWLAFRRSLKT